jgi:hypothetical protein
MSFYVPVGRRGAVFQIGMILTGVLGSFTYFWASLRRPAHPAPWPLPQVLLDYTAPQEEAVS